MRKSGFTLIELMIVTAILSIILHLMFPVIKAMAKESDYGQRQIYEAEMLTRFFLELKKELKQATTITDLGMTKVIFDNDLSFRFSGNGKTAFVGNREFRFPGRARITSLMPVDETHFITEIFTGADTVKVFWKVGE